MPKESYRKVLVIEPKNILVSLELVDIKADNCDALKPIDDKRHNFTLLPVSLESF